MSNGTSHSRQPIPRRLSSRVFRKQFDFSLEFLVLLENVCESDDPLFLFDLPFIPTRRQPLQCPKYFNFGPNLVLDGVGQHSNFHFNSLPRET